MDTHARASAWPRPRRNIEERIHVLIIILMRATACADNHTNESHGDGALVAHGQSCVGASNARRYGVGRGSIAGRRGAWARGSRVGNGGQNFGRSVGISFDLKIRSYYIVLETCYCATCCQRSFHRSHEDSAAARPQAAQWATAAPPRAR